MKMKKHIENNENFEEIETLNEYEEFNYVKSGKIKGNMFK